MNFVLEKRATNGRPYGLFQKLPHNRTADFEKENKYIKKVRKNPNLFYYIFMLTGTLPLL